MIKRCCKGCDRRIPGCHSTCSDYAEYRAELDKFKEEMRKDEKSLMVTYDKSRRIKEYLARRGIKK